MASLERGILRSRMTTVDWKQRAVEQWTADPCGPEVEGIHGLMRARREYAPWMAEQLDYEGARGTDVLDVGCGQGIDLCEFALAGANVTGIDLTPRHFELARKHLAEAGVSGTVLEGDAEEQQFPNASFDRIISNGVLHHTPDIERALRQIVRILRPGGRFTVILYNRNSWFYWLELVLWRGLVHRRLPRERMSDILSSDVERSSIGARPLVRAFTVREVRSMMERAGFNEVSTWVSPFQPSDTRFTRRLPKNLPLGGGWYVVGHGH